MAQESLGLLSDGGLAEEPAWRRSRRTRTGALAIHARRCVLVLVLLGLVYAGSRPVVVTHATDLHRAVVQRLAPPSLETRLRRFAEHRRSLKPKPVHRIWQLDRSGGEFGDYPRRWRTINPTWRYELLDDGPMRRYVQDVFAAEMPEIIDVYDEFPVTVMRTDLFRLLVLIAEGGIYADTDTEPIKPISEWPINADLFDDDLELVAGVELDWPDLTDAQMLEKQFTTRLQLLQWTIWAPRPGSRALVNAVLGALERWQQLKRDRMLAVAGQNLTSAEAIASLKSHLTQLDVVTVTGPGVFSTSILELMRVETNQNSTELSGLRYPRRFGSLLALPVTFWSPGEPHSGSKGMDDSYACIRHHFFSSWKEGIAKSGDSSDDA